MRKAETHEERKARLEQLCVEAAQAGFQLNTLIPAAPADIRTCLASGDENLNDIPIHKWDRNAQFLLDSGRFVYTPTSGPDAGKLVGRSLSDGVSMLKHYARYHYVDF